MKLAIIALTLPIVACQAEFRETYMPSPGTSAAAARKTAAPTPGEPETPAAPAATGAQPTADTTAPAAAGSATPAGTAAAAAPAANATGSISGTVSVRPAVAAGNLTNLVVWLDNPPGQQPPKDVGATAVLDQHGMNFYPTVLVVRKGGKVTFYNDDPFPHNVFTPDHEKFNLGTMAHGATSKRQFDEPGRYTLLCNLHPNMIAYIVVTPSSWFARPAKDGKYTIPGVPSGTYTVKAWGPRLGEQTDSVTVKDGDAALDLHLQPAD